MPLPDVEAIAVAYLAAHAELDLYVDGRVYADVPESPSYPFVTVTRVGGQPRPRPHWIDQAHLQVFAWSENDRAEAFDTCATALAALHELPGITALGVVTGVEDVLGPRPLYDPETSRPRFIAEVLVTAHPLVEVS